MKLWNELSMKEKHDIIRESVSKGIHSLDDIKAYYDNYYKDDIHLFLEGGPEETWTMEDEARFNEWRSNLPENLREYNPNNYDLRGAYKAGLQPTLENDGYYHLGSRNPKTGKILKTPTHDTFPLALWYGMEKGYNPVKVENGYVYTDTWEGNKYDYGPAFKTSDNIHYDQNTDTIYAPNTLGEYYQHEQFHARPDNETLNYLAPYYSNLDDAKLKKLGADLSFVKRIDNDPNYFYSPEELGARVQAAKFMLNKMGVKKIDNEFLNGARTIENHYGENFRDLLHMYNNENLLKILNTSYSQGGPLIQLSNRYKEGGPEENYTPSPNETDKIRWFEHWYNNREKQLADNYRKADTYLSAGDLIRKLLPNNVTDSYFAQKAKNHLLQNINSVSEGVLPTTRGQGNLTDNQYKVAQESLKQYVSDLTPEDYDKVHLLNVLQRGEYTPSAHTILYAPDAKAPTIIHERTHASNPGFIEKYIGNNYPTKRREGIEKDYYLDSANEVYSRLNAFRYRNNLDPTEIITPEKLEYLKKNAKDYDLLNRYDDDTLLFLFNDVAYNPTEQQDNPNITAFGGPLVKLANRFLEGGDKDNLEAKAIKKFSKQSSEPFYSRFLADGYNESEAFQKAKRYYEEFKDSDKFLFDEGNLPEVIIKPSKNDRMSLTKLQRMIPDAASRQAMYDVLAPDITEIPIISQNESIDRLYNIYASSKYPTVSSSRTLGNYLGALIRKENLNRSTYDIITNTINIPSEDTKYDATGFIPELAHAYQYYANDKRIKDNNLNSFFDLPGDIKINGKSGYERPGNREYSAHSIIEPAIWDYVEGKSNNMNLTYYLNPDVKRPGKIYRHHSQGGPLVHTANRYDGETEPTQQMYRMKITPNTVRFKNISLDPTGATYNLPEYVVTPQSNPDNGSRRVITLEEMAQQAAMNKAINEGMNRAGNIGAATMATSLAPALWSTVLSSGAFNWVTNPYIRVGLDTIGSVDSAKNLLSQQGILKTYNKFKENDYLGGIKSGAGDLLDIASTGDLLKIIRRFNKNNRALHAYNVISPYSYEKPFKRGLTWFEDIVNNTPVNIDSPKWKIDPKTEDYINKIAESIRPITYPNAQIEDVKKIVSETREDAWRMYNGLPLKYNSYISNEDGTFSYNMNKIINDSKNSYNRVHGNSQIDDITSAGGGLSSTIYPISSNLGIREIMDVWDLHPFIRQSDKLSRRLLNISDELISKGANNLYTSLFDKLYRYRFPYLYLGGLLLNRLRYTPPQFTDNKIFKYLDDKFSELEAGKIIGGTPFTMRTEIPYTTNVESFLKDLDVNSSAVLREKYGLSPNINLLNVDSKERLQAYNKGGLQELIKVINKQDLTGSNFKIDPTLFSNITDILRSTKNTTKFAEGGPKGKRFVDVLGNVVSAFGITPKYPDTMPTLWSEVLPEESYTELPTMTANQIEGRVAPLPNNNEDFIPDFTNIKTKDNFGYNIDNLTTAYHYFKDNMKLNDYQIASLLANGIAESGFDPKAHNPKTSAKGLYLWLDGRYKYSSNKMSNTELLNELLQYINDTLNNTEDLMSWHHGGDGSGYNKAIEAHDRFYNAKNLYDAVHSFTYGYNRPDSVALRVKQRYDLALKILERLLAKQHKEGGKIHIKPENRGKFTALKKRTGHSASWFKAHGTPALRKMATFALNTKKWKHDDGGFIDVPNLLLPPTKENLIYSGHKSWYNR